MTHQNIEHEEKLMESNLRIGVAIPDCDIQGEFSTDDAEEPAICLGHAQYLILRDATGDSYQIIEAQ